MTPSLAKNAEAEAPAKSREETPKQGQISRLITGIDWQARARCVCSGLHMRVTGTATSHHAASCLAGGTKPASTKAATGRSISKDFAISIKAWCLLRGICPPVPPLSDGKRHRLTVVSVVEAAIATGLIPPNRAMIEFAGSQCAMAAHYTILAQTSITHVRFP